MLTVLWWKGWVKLIGKKLEHAFVEKKINFLETQKSVFIQDFKSAK